MNTHSVVSGAIDLTTDDGRSVHKFAMSLAQWLYMGEWRDSFELMSGLGRVAGSLPVEVLPDKWADADRQTFGYEWGWTTLYRTDAMVLSQARGVGPLRMLGPEQLGWLDCIWPLRAVVVRQRGVATQRLERGEHHVVLESSGPVEFESDEEDNAVALLRWRMRLPRRSFVPASHHDLHVVIAGGGFCGAAVAAGLLRQDRVHAFVEVIEPDRWVGLGLAYGTDDPQLILNVPACRMSLFPDKPHDFLDFLHSRGVRVSGAEMVSRSLYGHYILERLVQLVATSRNVVRHTRGRAEGARRLRGGWSVHLADGGVIRAHALVLATGHGPLRCPDSLKALRGNQRLLDRPWLSADLQAISRSARVVIVGTGLTALDTLQCLWSQGHRGQVLALSNRGAWPRPHLCSDSASAASFELDDLPAVSGVDAMVRWAMRQFERAAGLGVPWQSVVDRLRELSPDLWRTLSQEDRRRFVREFRGQWEIARHRAPAATVESLRQWIGIGWLTVAAGTVLAAEERPDGVRLRVGTPDCHREVLAHHVLLCTGATTHPVEFQSPLWDGLIRDGWVQADPTGLGIVTDEHGRIQGVSGVASDLWAVGGVTRPQHYEATSVPDLAVHAASVAMHVASTASSALVERPVVAK